MSPIDDELRSLFSERTAVLAPAPDPLAGIERRAKRMRRNRVAASVAGTALAVSALAVAVPSFLPDTAANRNEIIPASAEPSPQSSPSGGLSSAALNPQDPWTYRGNPAVLGNGNLDDLKTQWAAKHPGTKVTPLFGQVYEPSGQTEIVFVSTSQGSDRWGIGTSSESGTEFLVDNALAYGSTVLMAALPGDEAARLLVLAAPSTGDISYAADGTSFSSLPMPVDGVAFRALEGDTSRDAVRVVDGDGDIDEPVFEGPAPDPGSADNGGAPSSVPANLIEWPARGATPEPAFLDKALAAFAQGLGAKRGDVEGRVLFAGDDDAGNVFVFGQAWIKGNDAHTFGYSENAKGEPTPFLGPVVEGPSVLAFIVPAGTGQSRETLVVIPEPAVKRTFYGPPASEYDEITGQEHLGGVTLIDRFPDTNDNDMLKLLDANGSKIFEGKVGPLLCGVRECG